MPVRARADQHTLRCAAAPRREATTADTFNLADGTTLQTAMMSQKFDQGRLQVRVLVSVPALPPVAGLPCW